MANSKIKRFAKMTKAQLTAHSLTQLIDNLESDEEQAALVAAMREHGLFVPKILLLAA